MADTDIKSLVESSFYLSYYAGIQPSEVDKLTTYEFSNYMRLVTERIKFDREREESLAQLSSGLGLLKNNI